MADAALIIKNKLGLDGTHASAVFSSDMKYRYQLSRIWDQEGPLMICILLNPSTGDEQQLETTTAGLMKRAKNWGYSGIVVYNLFALIATDPNRLYEEDDPVGPYNDQWLDKMTDHIPEGSIIICAWGNHGRMNNRDDEVVKMLPRTIYAFGINKGGTPRHPLHMSYSIKPTLWENNS